MLKSTQSDLTVLLVTLDHDLTAVIEATRASATLTGGFADNLARLTALARATPRTPTSSPASGTSPARGAGSTSAARGTGSTSSASGASPASGTGGASPTSSASPASGTSPTSATTRATRAGAARRTTKNNDLTLLLVFLAAVTTFDDLFAASLRRANGTSVAARLTRGVAG
jgi:hypothetical protein